MRTGINVEDITPEYGFEVNKKFCADAEQKVLKRIQHNLFV